MHKRISILLALIFLLFVSNSARCVASACSVALDSTSTQAPDSSNEAGGSAVPIYSVSSFHGSILSDTSVVWKSISKYDIQPWYYTSLADLFDVLLPSFPLSLGYHGQPHSWRVLGGGMRDNSVLFNGRALADVGLGVTNTAMYSPEDLERVQILIGSAAVVLADQSSGMAVNIQEQVHDTKGPYSRLWYADGANNYYASDGVLSQNVVPNVNVTVGFKRQAGDGRFDNQWLDAWNLRARVRWIPRPLTTVSLTENFTNHGTGSNGGVYVAGSTDINDEVTAGVRLPDVNERVFRHDLTLSVSSASDSSLRSLIQASAYLSHATSEISRSLSMVNSVDSSTLVKGVSVRAGATGKWEQVLGSGLRSTLGGDLEVNRNDATQYSDQLRALRAAAFAYYGYAPSETSSIHGGVRFQTRGSRSTLSAGVSVRQKLGNEYSAYVDLSRSARLPSAAEGLVQNAEQSVLGIVQIMWHRDRQNFEMMGFARQTRNAFVARAVIDTTGRLFTGTDVQAVPLQQTLGAQVQSSLSLMQGVWIDVFGQSAVTSRSDSTVRLLPSLYGMVVARYTKSYGSSELTAGVVSRFHSEFSGESFVPMNWMMVEATDSQSTASSGIDLFASAKLGNAWIKLRFQNVLSNTFTTVSTFPFPVRNFSLSVAWSFFD